VIVDDKGIKDSWKEYVEKRMNEENEWDRGISVEVKEGPADCIRIGEVVAALKQMKRHKAPGLSGLTAEMIQATKGIVTQWLLDLHMVWLSVNLECKFETCCMRLAENTGRKNSPKSRHLGTIPQLCRAISSQLRHVLTIGKNCLSSDISSTCPHKMLNFGPLAAEIVSLVWGTTANFNGFRVLAALLHGTLLVGVSQTLRR